ncbi:MAG: TolC family protein, partial [Alphaproteobacteria bacterium]|nr:TolC family protein [Alphaproteobacteria bacterium]
DQQLDTLLGDENRLDAQAHADIYALATLTGQAPGIALDLSHAPQLPEIVAAGIRSELLQRRPDIRAADADLAAATFDIGAAKAQLYPHFSIMGGLGQQAQHGSDLFSGDSTRFVIGPSFSWPIFNAGRIKAQVRGTQARADAAQAAYEKAVLGALADSETALNRYANDKLAYANAASANENARDLARLAKSRFEAGEDDRVQMLEAQASALANAQSLETARGDALAAYVALSKALGGGWEMPPATR